MLAAKPRAADAVDLVPSQLCNRLGRRLAPIVRHSVPGHRRQTQVRGLCAARRPPRSKGRTEKADRRAGNLLAGCRFVRTELVADFCCGLYRAGWDGSTNDCRSGGPQSAISRDQVTARPAANLPTRKNVACTLVLARISSNCGVHAGLGPSSKVSASSPVAAGAISVGRRSASWAKRRHTRSRRQRQPDRAGGPIRPRKSCCRLESMLLPVCGTAGLHCNRWAQGAFRLTLYRVTRPAQPNCESELSHRRILILVRVAS